MNSKNNHVANGNKLQKRILDILIVALVLAGSAFAQTNILSASDGDADDNFGFSLAASGNTVVVGAWQNDSVLSNSGAAYIFERDATSNHWHQVIKLTPDDADFAGDEFGKAVAIDGNWLIVGAQFDDSASKDFGAAYVFERTPNAATPWTIASKLSANDGAFRDFFGRTVAISGTRVVVGAPEDDGVDKQCGSAYVFELDPSNGSWKQVAKLTAIDGEGNDHFGSAVAIGGDIVMVGASEHSHNDVNNTGAVYVFGRQPDGSWTQTSKLTANDSDELDQFGYAIAMVGNRTLIGAPFDDDKDNVGGSAYLFEYAEGTNTWTQVAKLTSSNPKLGNRFGHSVALVSEQILIGSPGDDQMGNESGAAYLFHYDQGSWNQLDKLTLNDGVMDDEFGFAVSLVEDWIFVSKIEDNGRNKTESGSVHLFQLEY